MLSKNKNSAAQVQTVVLAVKFGTINFSLWFIEWNPLRSID